MTFENLSKTAQANLSKHARYNSMNLFGSCKSAKLNRLGVLKVEFSSGIAHHWFEKYRISQREGRIWDRWEVLVPCRFRDKSKYFARLSDAVAYIKDGLPYDEVVFEEV